MVEIVRLEQTISNSISTSASANRGAIPFHQVHAVSLVICCMGFHTAPASLMVSVVFSRFDESGDGHGHHLGFYAVDFQRSHRPLYRYSYDPSRDYYCHSMLDVELAVDKSCSSGELCYCLGQNEWSWKSRVTALVGQVGLRLRLLV